ncbi:MAG: hypothetical protein E7595_06315 [Ruminococcaceae bacterium]|jgi:glucose-6-phosphate 1-dehydrogenase|nr:hypothetical protein [Oscillospiraceae bacterium]
MNTLDEKMQQELMDALGEKVVKEVRDGALTIARNRANYTSVNPVDRKTYAALSDLTDEQKNAVCYLLSKTVTATIYRFLKLFEYYPDEMKLILSKNGNDYDILDISEEVGAEIASEEEDGWIQRFSEI